MVKSAAKFVSYILLKLSKRRAAASFPGVRLPAGKPNSSAKDTLTAGAH